METVKEEHIAIRKTRLESIVKSVRNRENENEDELTECVAVIYSALTAHQT